MKSKTLKRICAVLLATSTLALAACGQETTVQSTEKTPQSTEQTVTESTNSTDATESQYPEYLNLDSPYPVIKDEYADDITLSVMILMQDNAGEWEDLWISKYFSEKYNINLDVEYVYSANAGERVNLMLNSADLPDMMINLGLTNSQVMTYGVEEGLFLQLDQYMNETLTPNILRYFTGQAAVACTAKDGHVYTLPYMSNQMESGSYKRIIIRKSWLEDLGLQMPKTLDDFVDTMYAIKEADPAGVGSENLYPFGSGDKMGSTLGWYILNAFGYVEASDITGDSYGLLPAVRDGEAVIPVYDMEVYQEYLKLMNQFYTDGIINPTYFTMEEEEMKAQAAEGKTATFHNFQSVAGITGEAELEWDAMSPLTSKWQTVAEVAAPEYATPGNFAVSAKTEYPELCMRFAELFFNNDTDINAAFNQGPIEGSEWDFGYVGRIFDEKQNKLTQDTLPEGYNGWSYQCECLFGNVWQFGTTIINDSIQRYASELGHPEFAGVPKGQHEEGSIYNSIYFNIEPYTVEDCFPLDFYLSNEETERMAELKTVLEPYVEEQVALFITGKRPLSETGDFVKEMEKLGIKELLDMYKEIYAATK